MRRAAKGREGPRNSAKGREEIFFGTVGLEAAKFREGPRNSAKGREGPRRDFGGEIFVLQKEVLGCRRQPETYEHEIFYFGNLGS